MRWPDAAALEAPLTTLRGAGPKLAEAAAELGIESVGDLLRHIPHSYRDRAAPVRLGDLKLGEEATVVVEVRGGVRARPTRRRGLTILEAKVADASGTATATWFNRAWLADRLAPGTRLLLRGKLEKRGFTVTEHELLGGDGGPEGLHTTGLVPVHPASERIRPQRLREWAWQARGRARGGAGAAARARCGWSWAIRLPGTRSRPPTSRPRRPPQSWPGAASPSRSWRCTRPRW